jgi:hypothetical protein
LTVCVHGNGVPEASLVSSKKEIPKSGTLAEVALVANDSCPSTGSSLPGAIRGAIVQHDDGGSVFERSADDVTDTSNVVVDGDNDARVREVAAPSNCGDFQHNLLTSARVPALVNAGWRNAV